MDALQKADVDVNNLDLSNLMYIHVQVDILEMSRV
jgi:hypothetical protein